MKAGVTAHIPRTTAAAVADAKVGDFLDDRMTWRSALLGNLIDDGAHADIINACRQERKARERAGDAPHEGEDAMIEDECAAAFYIGLAIGRRAGAR